MNPREERIYQEAAALWRELYGEPPPVRTDGGTLIDVIMRTLPDIRYDRIRSPYLRRSAVAWPVTTASARR